MIGRTMRVRQDVASASGPASFAALRDAVCLGREPPHLPQSQRRIDCRRRHSGAFHCRSGAGHRRSREWDIMKRDPQTSSLVSSMAEFVHRTGFGDLPDPIRRIARQHVLDTIGCCLAAARLETSRSLASYLMSEGGTGQATAISIPRQLPAPQAAFMNGLLARSLEYDDMATPDLHPSGVIVPVVLAVNVACIVFALNLLGLLAPTETTLDDLSINSRHAAAFRARAEGNIYCRNPAMDRARPPRMIGTRFSALQRQLSGAGLVRQPYQDRTGDRSAADRAQCSRWH